MCHSESSTYSELMVSIVQEHSPERRWYELRQVRDFKTNGRKVETMFNHLAEMVLEAIDCGELKP